MCHRLQAMEAISPKLLLSLLPILWLTTQEHMSTPCSLFWQGCACLVSESNGGGEGLWPLPVLIQFSRKVSQSVDKAQGACISKEILKGNQLPMAD